MKVERSRRRRVLETDSQKEAKVESTATSSPISMPSYIDLLLGTHSITTSTSGGADKVDFDKDLEAASDVWAAAETMPADAENELREQEADDYELKITDLSGWVDQCYIKPAHARRMRVNENLSMFVRIKTTAIKHSQN